MRSRWAGRRLWNRYWAAPECLAAGRRRRSPARVCHRATVVGRLPHRYDPVCPARHPRVVGYETVSFRLLSEGGSVMPDGVRRWWALIAVAASVLVVGLDLTVLNLALPVLAR